MDVVKNAVEHLNPGQTPVVTFDQPLFALAKQIQWKWPASYGEDQLVVVFGGLHIEMAALRTLGDWMQGSGWVQALVQAEIATAGSADSFIRASHVLRTRRAHQVTAAALYILQHRAYSHYCRLGQTRDAEDLSEFESWCCQRGKDIPQFHYWATMLELELLLLVYVRSLRQGSLMMYIEALTELVPWFYALDHTHYARWIPVHLKDMAELTTKHPDVAKKFKESHFTVQKTQRAFSSIPIDQAHEQNNACIKGDGGAVGLTDNPSALRRWMVAGPEVVRVIEEFQDVGQHCRQKKADTRHHDQTPSVQTSFVKDVRSLVDVIEEMGNSFEEESQDVVKLDTKEIAGPAAVETVMNAKRIGQEQFEAFTKECLFDRTKAVYDPIHRNNLKVFRTSTPRNQSKGQQQLVSVKNDRELFARLYIGCQARGGNLEQFFCHENQACLIAEASAQDMIFALYYYNFFFQFSFLILTSLQLGERVLPLIEESKFVIEKSNKDIYDAWKSPPVPVLFKIYFFNVSNPEEVKNKAIPHLTEVGPYVFKETRDKVKINFTDNGDSISYRNKKSYEFDPDSSKGSLDDYIQTVNVPYVGMAKKIKNFPLLLKSAFNGVASLYDEDLFMTKTVKELAFDGYKEPIVNFIQTKFKFMAPILPNATFGFFYESKISDDGLFKVHTGKKESANFTIIEEWNNESHLNYWKSKYCNMLNGTDGGQFPPSVSKKDVLYTFSTDLCRSLHLTYEKNVDHHGISTYRFIAPEDLFADPRTFAPNKCYCTTKPCFGKGLLDISSCKKGAPVVMSSPHFYQAAKEYQDAVVGLTPDKTKHETLLDVEPNTGAVLKAAKRVQINVHIEPSSSTWNMEHVNEIVFPILWVEEGATINEKSAKKFKDLVFKPKDIVYGVVITLVVLGCIVLIIAIILVVILHKKVN
ncbi:Lysosome membrane protein 2 [Nymphon striatum]|nr:Lysosome membrane protein 2 [Nymphon striatum]